MRAFHDLSIKWGVPCKLKQHDKGWVIFQFQSENDRNKVMAEEPYALYGKAVFLRILSEDFDFDGEEFLKVPIWVKFPGLSVTLWNKQEMNELASRVGVPIVADKVTQEKSRSQFARVLVEVDLSRPPTMSIPIIQPSGKERNQYVIYETFPNYCFECKVYGHHPFTCKVLNKELVENEDAKATNKIVSVANTAANNSKEGGSNQPGDIPKGKKGFNVSGKKSKDDGKGKEIWVEKKKNDVQENGEWVEAKKKKKWVSKPKANVRNLITPKVPTPKAPTTNAAASTSTPKATTPAAQTPKQAAQAPKQAAQAPKQAASAQKQTAEAVKVAPRLTVPK
ncbi:unnamed protein product [Cuscuta europaea]|nr:unnamed protein product [Cuscuta europaea]